MKWRIGVIVLLLVVVALTGWMAYRHFNGPTFRPGDAVAFVVKDVDLVMRYVPAATFPTGLEDENLGTAGHDFWIAETEVTYLLWYEVRNWAEEHGYEFRNKGTEGNEGRSGREPTENADHPVVRIPWHDAVAWCNALSEYLDFEPVYTYGGDVFRDARDRKAAVDTVSANPVDRRNVKGFRLPTFYEWQLAARYQGRNRSRGAIRYPMWSWTFWTPGTHASGSAHPYTNEEAMMDVAWYSGNSGGTTQPVGLMPPGGNSLNLYDMSGNVWEWIDPPDDDYRLYVGGCYYREASRLQIGRQEHPRGSEHRSLRTFYRNVGFRPVLSLQVSPVDVRERSGEWTY